MVLILVLVIIGVVLIVENYNNENNLPIRKTDDIKEIKKEQVKNANINLYLVLILILTVSMPVLIPIDIIVGIILKLCNNNSAFAKALYICNKILLVLLCIFIIDLGVCIFSYY